jgi:hypothetical protein
MRCLGHPNQSAVFSAAKLFTVGGGREIRCAGLADHE